MSEWIKIENMFMPFVITGGGNNRPVASNWQTLSHNVVEYTSPEHHRFQTCLGQHKGGYFFTSYIESLHKYGFTKYRNLFKFTNQYFLYKFSPYCLLNTAGSDYLFFYKFGQQK
jgi:hypothetical protein